MVSKECARIAGEERRLRQAAKYILREPWGGYFQECFRSLYEEGLVRQDSFGDWRLESGMTITEYVKSGRQHDGHSFSFPGNLYVWASFCPRTLLEGSATLSSIAH